MVQTLTGAEPYAEVSVQSPVRLGERDEPEPDLAALRPREGERAREAPTASDVLFLVEVADSTSIYDRRTKLPLHARAGVPEVWIVDLQAQIVERYTMPEGGSYRKTATAGRAERLASETSPRFVLEAANVLD